MEIYEDNLPSEERLKLRTSFVGYLLFLTEKLRKINSNQNFSFFHWKFTNFLRYRLIKPAKTALEKPRCLLQSDRKSLSIITMLEKLIHFTRLHPICFIIKISKFDDFQFFSKFHIFFKNDRYRSIALLNCHWIMPQLIYKRIETNQRQESISKYQNLAFFDIFNFFEIYNLLHNL